MRGPGITPPFPTGAPSIADRSRRAVPRGRVLLGGGLALVVGLTSAGCAPTSPDQPPTQSINPSDERLVARYFEQNNVAAAQSSAAEQDFLRRTQHPDFPNSACELDGMALTIQPTMSTLRLDPGWAPPGGTDHPRGQVYFVAVEVTAKRDGSVVGNQIGYQHVVTLGQQAFGFAPCAST